MLTNKIYNLWTCQFKLQGKKIFLEPIQNLTPHDYHFNHFLYMHLFEEAVRQEAVIPPSNRKSIAGWNIYLEIKSSRFSTSSA